MKHLQLYLFFGVPFTIAICVYICFLGNTALLLLAGAGVFLLNLCGKRLKSFTATSVESNVEKVRLRNELEKADMLKEYTDVLGKNMERSTNEQLLAAREHLAIQKAVWEQELLTRKKVLNADVERRIDQTKRKESEWTNHQIEMADFELAQLQRKQHKELEEKTASFNKLLRERKIGLEQTKNSCKESVNKAEKSARMFRREFLERKND